jgi:hypothetical protein
MPFRLHSGKIIRHLNFISQNIDFSLALVNKLVPFLFANSAYKR